MEEISREDACNALKLLADAAANRQAELDEYKEDDEHPESEEEIDSESPVLDQFFAEGGAEAILQMTNFSLPEFNGIWDLIRTHVATHWNVGRGKKSSFKAKDVLLMTLTVLKHGGSWDFLSKMFKIKGPTFERTVMTFVDVIEPFLFKQSVANWEKKFTMDRLMADKTVFKYSKHALYATDVTFQQSNRPSGNHEEAKGYFSGKHKLYGYKNEVSVLPNGLAINVTEHYPGSVADLVILRENLKFHRNALRKTESEEADYHDIGALAEEFKGFWALIMDKGYQGAEEILRAVIPKRKPRNGVLTSEDTRRNKKIASDRIIVEMFLDAYALYGS